jgi:microcystin-dependent protein
MSCINCFDGCTEITSDKCVRYTGPSVASLGINNGDTLLSVQGNITTYLVSALNGTGINSLLDENSLCALVSQYLPGSGTINLVQVIDAIMKSVCSLQVQITDAVASVAVIEADYTLGCLTGVNSSSGTHLVLQAAIDELCTLQSGLTALGLDVSTNYVKVADINNYIDAYLVANQSYALISATMTPHCPVPFFPPSGYLTGKFDGAGVGIGDWAGIYFCNGSNSTPDMRGVVPVGLTDGGMYGGALNSTVDPAVNNNPNYELNYAIQGANQVVLGETHIPAHIHANTANTTITPSSHNHGFTGASGNGKPDGGGNVHTGLTPISYPVGGQLEDITISASTQIINASAGGGLPHSNVQPSIGCYYIIYIP